MILTFTATIALLWWRNQTRSTHNSFIGFKLKIAELRVDDKASSAYHFAMDKQDSGKLNEQALKGLEIRVDDLIKTCEELKKENHLLKLQQDSYTTERATLIDKNEQARKRVEAMITRLKSMEVTV